MEIIKHPGEGEGEGGEIILGLTPIEAVAVALLEAEVAVAGDTRIHKVCKSLFHSRCTIVNDSS